MTDTELSQTIRNKLFPLGSLTSAQKFFISIFLVAIHSLLLGLFIFFFTDMFYVFFFGTDVQNYFFVKQSGLFLFCLGLFYLVPLIDVDRYRRLVDIIVSTKILAVLFLIMNTQYTPRPGIIILASILDAAMAAVLIYFGCNAKRDKNL